MTAPIPDEAAYAGRRAAWDHIPADRPATVREVRAAVTAALTAAAPHIRAPLEAEVERLRAQLVEAEDAIGGYEAAVTASIAGHLRGSVTPTEETDRG